MNPALQKLFAIYDGQAATARALGVSKMAVSKWKRTGVTAERALQIEIVTNGAITRQDLRPDLFGIAALGPARRIR